jgi:hypothetical protein
VGKAKAKPTENTRPTRQEQRLAHEERRMAHTLKLAKVDLVYKLGRTALIGGVFVFCVYFITGAFQEMAGKTTNISAMIKAVADFDIGKYLAYAVAAVCGIGWTGERRARRRTIKGQNEHIKALESRLDPKRQSSGLLPDGQTKKEDKDV